MFASKEAMTSEKKHIGDGCLICSAFELTHCTSNTFPVGIPFLIITMALREWPFGSIMCKIYFTTTSINQITSSIFLTILSGTRYHNTFASQKKLDAQSLLEEFLQFCASLSPKKKESAYDPLTA